MPESQAAINYLKKQNNIRAFIEVKEWNKSNIHSIAKINFKQLGVARKIGIINKNVVIWDKTSH